MDLSKEAAMYFQNALSYAAQNQYEFLTPEMLLLAILEDPTFSAAFEECGGDIAVLHSRLVEYISEYVVRTSDQEARLSVGANFVLKFAAQSAYSDFHGAKTRISPTVD